MNAMTMLHVCLLVANRSAWEYSAVRIAISPALVDWTELSNVDDQSKTSGTCTSKRVLLLLLFVVRLSSDCV